jgi:flavin-dependent dehydrogenase
MRRGEILKNEYDVIIAGAGSAGLSTAIFCAREGMKVIILEKSSHTAPFPRGETIRPDPVLDELLGPGFMEAISYNRTAERRYYSPWSIRHFSLERDQASYIFHWHDLTEGLRREAEKSGVEIKFSCEVTDPVIDNGICRGVSTKNDGDFYGKSVIAGDGHNSIFGEISGVDYTRLNCPIAKRVCRQVETDYEGMEFFLIPRGTLDYAPDFPPSIAFIFPRGNGDAEAGLMLLGGGMSLKDRKAMPGNREILSVLQQMSLTYPVFSARLRNSEVDFEGVSVIPMAGLHNEVCAIPGLILTGDAIGLVEASGGCGVVATMKNGAFAARFLSEHRDYPWDKNLMRKINREFRKTDVYRLIRSKYRKIIPLMRIVFHRWVKPSMFVRLWKFMETRYKKV